MLTCLAIAEFFNLFRPTCRESVRDGVPVIKDVAKGEMRPHDARQLVADEAELAPGAT